MELHQASFKWQQLDLCLVTSPFTQIRQSVRSCSGVKVSVHECYGVLCNELWFIFDKLVIRTKKKVFDSVIGTEHCCPLLVCGQNIKLYVCVLLTCEPENCLIMPVRSGSANNVLSYI